MSIQVFRSVSQIEDAIGEPLGTTDWTDITQDTVNGFADITGDHQWIHVDVRRAAESQYNGTIAHGYLTLSLLPAFAQRIYRFDVGSARLNYGLDRARFPAPLPVGSRVRATPIIKAVHGVRAGTQVVVEWTVQGEGIPRPVCVAECITLLVD